MTTESGPAKPRIRDIVKNIRLISKNYSPNDKVKDQIARVCFIPLIGPSSSGKTSTIKTVVAKNSNFGAIRTLTTRPKRADETGNLAPLFLPHNERGLGLILNGLIKGDIVQTVVHPTSGYVYASYAREYDHSFNMLELLSSAVGNLALYNFGGFKPIGIVATKEDWWPRIESLKQTIGPGETNKRIAEGVSSLEWLLQNPEVPIVINRQGQLENTAENVIGLCLGTQFLNPDNRQVAAELLESLQTRGTK